jgi:hypothetical protein
MFVQVIVGLEEAIGDITQRGSSGHVQAYADARMNARRPAMTMPVRWARPDVALSVWVLVDNRRWR